MNAISYVTAQKKLAETIKKVCDDHMPVIITGEHNHSAVIISLEDYQAMEKTAYLLRSPENARRLWESVTELEKGGGRKMELIEI